MTSLNVELRYGSPKHTSVLNALLARIRLSKDFVSKKETHLQEADKQYQAYIPTEDKKSSNNSCAIDTGEVDTSEDYTTIYIPYSYSTLLAAHTYWCSVFLSRSPVLQFQGRHGEAEDQVLAVESLIDYQMTIGGNIAPLYIWMLDAAKYGYGVLCNYWDVEELTVASIMEVPMLDPAGFPLGTQTKKEKKTATIPGYVGNRNYTVNPYDYLPDPRVSLVDLQKGEFVGRLVDIGWNDMVRGQQEQRYFNVDVVRRRNLARQANKTLPWDPDGMLPSTYEDISTADIKDVGTTSCVHIFVELIPQEWGLGTGASPEKWVFTVAAEEIIVEARPYGALHNKYPFFVIPYEVDGYNVLTRGMLELLKPLNDTLSWLVNTHFYNVRSVLNGSFVFDPMKVNTTDLLRKGAGKLIRLRREAWGSDVRSAITQLPVMDVTQTHLKDAQIVGDMIQRISAVTDNVMGMVNPGGRKTATEIRSSNTFGISRLKTTAEFWSEVGFKPLAQVMLQQTQQYYDLERMYKVAGDTGTMEMMRITPESIAGFFDYIAVDGTMPVDRYAQANLWREILGGLMKMPQLAMTYNVPGIFEWVAQLAGLKNIKRFRVQGVDPMQLAAASAAGNVQPIGGQNGRLGNQQPGLVERGLGRPPNVMQVPGMGPAM